jgi:hypothetical protein
VYLFDDWFDPIEAQVRERERAFIHAMIEGELDETLKRPRYGLRCHLRNSLRQRRSTTSCGCAPGKSSSSC